MIESNTLVCCKQTNKQRSSESADYRFQEAKVVRRGRGNQHHSLLFHRLGHCKQIPDEGRDITAERLPLALRSAFCGCPYKRQVLHRS